MKKFFLLFVLCCFAGVASAQYVETVHLKNGGVIHGIIIEQIPNQNLKIQTSNGNIFVYSFDEIEKITKKAPEGYGMTNESYRPNYNQTFQEPQVPNYNRPFRQFQIPKYQGSVDLGYSFGVGGLPFDRIELSTFHGCSVGSYFYVGFGLGAHFYYDVSEYLIDDCAFSLPIFADFRGNLMNGNIKPFLDLRIGYSFCDFDGLYLSPSVGISIGKLDISLGYTLQKTNILWVYCSSPYDWWEESSNLGAVTLKMGVRF